MKNSNNSKIKQILNQSPELKISLLSCIVLVILFFSIETLLKNFEYRHISLLFIFPPVIFLISHNILKRIPKNTKENLLDICESNYNYKSLNTNPSLDINNFKNQIKHKLEENFALNRQIEETIYNELMFTFLNQAQNTESAIATISDYINSLNSLVQKEDEITNKLEEIIQLLNECNIKLNNNVQEVLKISEGFLTLKNESIYLKEGSHNILKLLEYIKNLVKDTQLLSFNASIEAARAGDSGKSFTIIANEIRKLSQNVKSSVENITNNLDNFINRLNFVIKEIETKYEMIISKAENFKTMSSTAYDNINQIKLISDSLFDAKDKILNQVNKGQNVYDKISNLSQNFDKMSEISGNILEKIAQQNEYLQQMLDIVNNFDINMTE